MSMPAREKRELQIVSGMDVPPEFWPFFGTGPVLDLTRSS
jgi:hypothetical protein